MTMHFNSSHQSLHVREILDVVFSFLSPMDCARLATVNTFWFEIAMDHAWRNVLHLNQLAPIIPGQTIFDYKWIPSVGVSLRSPDHPL